MKKKKLYYLFILLIATVSISACGKKEPVEVTSDITIDYAEPQTEISADIDFLTFEGLIDRATHVVWAKCVEVSGEEDDLKLTFTPVKQLKGKIAEDEFVVSGSNRRIYVTGTEYKYKEDYSHYNEETEYLLILEKFVSVFDEADEYTILGHAYFPIESFEKITMYGCGLLNELASYDEDNYDGYQSYDELIPYIVSLVEKDTTNKEFYGKDYISSNNLKEIVEQTNTILRVKITEHWEVGVKGDREMCSATVVETLKGEAMGETISMVWFKDMVTTGEEYIVLLDKLETASFYIPSSKDSIYPITDIEKVEEIRALIE